MTPWNYSITYIQWSEHFKKFACLFAGMNHMQPLLLATTNSHYLLDRFCMERCCSSEYVSRIVTSLIFMEILATLLVAPIGVGVGIKKCSDPDAQNLVNHTRKEEEYKGYISITIQFIILLGYLQILYAFTTGGKKGHMHWFYFSLIFQYFVICLIAGGIGFWDVGHALWYLMTIPVGPIPVFFYQLMIHSWIRSHGPRDVEYIVVECQIVLALSLSCMATIFWAVGYSSYYTPAIITNLDTLDKLNTTDSPNANITKTHIVTAKEYTVAGGASTDNTATISATAGQTVTVTIKYIKVTLSSGVTPSEIKVHPGKTLKVDNSTQTAKVTAEVQSVEAGGSDKSNVTIKIENPEETLGTRTVSGASKVQISKIYLVLEHTGSITVQEGVGGSETKTVVTGYAYIANRGRYIKSISKDSEIWKEEWDGEKCLYVACYYNGTSASADTPALLKLHVIGNTLTTKYYGTQDNGSTWYVITANKFNNKLNSMITSGTFSLTATDGTQATDPRHNPKFNMVLFDPSKWKWWPPWEWKLENPSQTWLPLLMQGLSVGAVGSIFPNLIPKTLTCPKTTRTLTVMNMFLVTVPHIFNVMLGDMDLLGWIGVGRPWEKPFHTVWSLYLFYLMAFLFAIFNIHYPEWALSCFLRNNTWFVFLMILFTDVLNETFNAISRAGICSQKSAVGGKKNHPCLHNKIHCLMNLTYIPFWLTTTPMMKSYVSSLDPFLCDKDRDHWPTARYGRLRSFGYWCKCGLRGLYTSPRKLITLDMRKALTRKDPPLFYILRRVHGVLLMTSSCSMKIKM